MRLVVTASEPARELGRAAARTLARHCGHLGVLASRPPSSAATPWLDEVIAVPRLQPPPARASCSPSSCPRSATSRPQAGYLAWLDCRELGLGDDPAAAILERGRVALSPGPQFGTGGEGFARLNFGTSPELVTEAVERMAQGVDGWIEDPVDTTPCRGGER